MNIYREQMRKEERTRQALMNKSDIPQPEPHFLFKNVEKIPTDSLPVLNTTASSSSSTPSSKTPSPSLSSTSAPRLSAPFATVASVPAKAQGGASSGSVLSEEHKKEILNRAQRSLLTPQERYAFPLSVRWSKLLLHLLQPELKRYVLLCLLWLIS